MVLHDAGERLDRSMRTVLSWLVAGPWIGLAWAAVLCLLTVGFGIGMTI